MDGGGSTQTPNTDPWSAAKPIVLCSPALHTDVDPNQRPSWALPMAPFLLKENPSCGLGCTKEKGPMIAITREDHRTQKRSPASSARICQQTGGPPGVLRTSLNPEHTRALYVPRCPQGGNSNRPREERDQDATWLAACKQQLFEASILR